MQDLLSPRGACGDRWSLRTDSRSMRTAALCSIPTKVANALKVPASAFFEDDTYEKPPLSDREKKLVKGLRSLEDEDIQEGL